MNDTDNLKVKRNLNALAEFSRIINSSFDLPFILNNVLLTCMGKYLATRGVIALNIDGDIKLHSHKGIPEDVIKKFPSLKSDDTLPTNTELKAFLGLGKLCIVEKISSSNDTIGLICLGEKMNKTPYTEEDIEFLRTILNISATAIQNSIVLTELKKVNRMLDSRLHRLSSLFELSKEFSLITENERVSKLLVYSIIGQFLVSRFAVVLCSNSEITILESKWDEKILLDTISKIKAVDIITYLDKDEIKQYDALNALDVQLIVPMQLQGETKGLILLGKRINSAPFTANDIEFIYSVGSLAIISIENRRLFREEIEKQKMEEELEIARDIQRNLLPHSIPSYDRFDIAALNISSKQVGGDFYDIIPLDEKSFCAAIADVSGKGVPAALLMANLQAFLKTTCKHGMQLNEATELINDLISENTMDGKFITFFWGILNNSDMTLNYVNAGHNPPLLIRNKKIIKLTKGGIILGVMKTFVPYETETIALQKDDLLVLFTDGVTEARNKAEDEFGDDKLEQIAINNSFRSAEEVIEIIRQEVQYFSTGIVQSDDITLLVIKVK